MFVDSESKSTKVSALLHQVRDSVTSVLESGNINTCLSEFNLLYIHLIKYASSQVAVTDPETQSLKTSCLALEIKTAN